MADTQQPTHNKTIEWESTITIRIDKSVYDTVLEKRRTTRGISSDVILIFTDGSRLSSRTVQRKVVTEKKLVLGYLNGQFYPIRRTRATEETTNIDPTLSIEKAVHRLIVEYDDSTEDDKLRLAYHDDNAENCDCCKLRLAYNKEEIEYGVRYTLSCEAEYSQTSTYDQIIEYEERLMQKISSHFYGIHVTPDKLTLGEMFSCVMPKVQMWNCFNPQRRYLWAYKWNGVKAKFMCIDGHVYIWPDASEISTHAYQGNLAFMKHMCLQVELMEDRIVIVEVVAAAYYEEIYTVEPLTNVAILRHLNTALPKSAVTVGNKRLTVQTFYNTYLPKRFDETKYDGFIIVQQDLTIKWKPPTVDVKCVGPYEYMVGSNNQTVIIRLPEPNDDDERNEIVGIKGCVYEMSSNFKILRRRVDRMTCSTSKEYQAFLESIKLINPL